MFSRTLCVSVFLFLLYLCTLFELLSSILSSVSGAVRLEKLRCNLLEYNNNNNTDFCVDQKSKVWHVDKLVALLGIAHKATSQLKSEEPFRGTHYPIYIDYTTV